MAYEQGAIWRRWDPHIHLPGTARNNQFGDLTIGDALDTLAEQSPAIEVVGVTDYCTTDIFRLASAEHAQGRGARIAELFPNVELRLGVGVPSGSGINVHLMCAPDHVDELDRILRELKFRDRRTFRCTRDDLIGLGRLHSGNDQLDEAAALSEGVNQFKVDIGDIEAILRNDEWARQHLLFGVAARQHDGASGLRGDSGFTSLRRSIERLAHIIFSSNASDSAFWLGNAPGMNVAEIIAEYGALKPCIHGSDAHCEDRLGVPDRSRMTWIKGDPSFAALQMARLAPGTRVHVGEHEPYRSEASRRVTSVKVRNAEWFANEEVLINPGLVAVIGARGSGKTALADVIAAAAGSDESYGLDRNDQTFLRRARELLRAEQSTAEVTWNEGSPTSAELWAPPSDDWLERPVRYLTQKFVEQLCSSDGVTTSLLTEIERVVFEAWPMDRRQGATTFDELRDIMLVPLRSERAGLLDEMSRLGGELADLRALRTERPATERERAELTRGVAELETLKRGLVGAANRGDADRFLVVSQAYAERLTEADHLDRRAAAVRSLQEGVSTFRRFELPDIGRRWRQDAELIQFDERDWEQFELSFSGDVDRLLADKLVGLQQELASIRGTEDDTPQPPRDGLTEDELRSLPVAALQAECRRLEVLCGLDENRALQLARLDTQLASKRRRVEQLGDKMQRIERVAGQVQTLAAERQAHYIAYFDGLLREAQILNELYAPLAEVLGTGPGSLTKLHFSVQRKVDLSKWASRGEELLDARKSGDFRGQGTLEGLARAALLPAWCSGDAAAASDAVRQFARDHEESLRAQARGGELSDSEFARSWERDVSAWLYDASHVTLSYSLEYEGTDIGRLSPGTRGIVLLLLYLAIDKTETDPLIIDQPEENLDPESVFRELVHLFRQASERRQIIMVTHNANLVVNTDVDQVIVATSESAGDGTLPRISYRSGGLDNTEIRRSVCAVLEGGEQAFLERARRLGLGISPLS